MFVDPYEGAREKQIIELLRTREIDKICGPQLGIVWEAVRVWMSTKPQALRDDGTMHEARLAEAFVIGEGGRSDGGLLDELGIGEPTCAVFEFSCNMVSRRCDGCPITGPSIVVAVYFALHSGWRQRIAAALEKLGGIYFMEYEASDCQELYSYVDADGFFQYASTQVAQAIQVYRYDRLDHTIWKYQDAE
jgi:hypothetical protein